MSDEKKIECAGCALCGDPSKDWKIKPPDGNVIKPGVYQREILTYDPIKFTNLDFYVDKFVYGTSTSNFPTITTATSATTSNVTDFNNFFNTTSGHTTCGHITSGHITSGLDRIVNNSISSNSSGNYWTYTISDIKTRGIK